MHKFDYNFLKSNFISSKILNIITGIYSLKTLSNTRKEANIKIFSQLEKIAKVRSVKSSNAIEGIVTSDERIRAIVLEDTASLN